jgi:gliding motility-associated-like protein
MNRVHFIILLLLTSLTKAQTCTDFPEITASTTNLCAGLSATLSVNYTPPTICNMNITPSTIPLGNPIPGFTYAGIFNGHYYYVYNTPTSWTQGELICRQNGGYLVCINDINENAFVSNSTNNNIWIGMFRDPVTCNFRWLDCLNITFTNWRPGEPNSGPCGEPYVQIIRGCGFGLNTWNNLDNNSSNGSCYSNMVPIMEIDPSIYNTPITPSTTYLWSTGETTSSITVSPTATTNYWVDITTGTLTCRKNITINVGPSISPTANPTQTFCGSATIADLSAIGTNIQWYASSTVGAPLAPTTTLVNGGSYYATQTITGCESQIRTLVNVTILPQTASPSGNSTQSFCSSATLSEIVVTGNNIQWYSSITGGTSLNSNSSLINGTTYYASQTINSCESTTRLAVTVNINNPQISATSNTICLGESSTLTASNTNNPTSNSCSMPSNLQNGLVGYWPFCGNANDESGNGNNGTVNGAALTTDRFGNANNSYYFSSAGCATRIDAQVNTSSIQTGLTISIWVLRVGDGCISPRILEFWPAANPNGPGMAQWGWGNGFNTIGIGSTTSSGFGCYAGIPVGGNNIWYNIVYTNDGTTGKFYKDGVLISTLASNGNPILAGSAAFGRMNHPAYDNLNGKLDDIGVWNRALTQQEIQQLYSQSITTYLWSTGETTATITVTPSTTTNYWVDVTSNGVTCRKNISITVNSSTPAPTAPSPQTFCNSATVADLIATGNNIKWYSSATGGTPLSNATLLVNGSTYYASQTLGGCESSVRFPVNVIVNLTPTPSGSFSQTFCNSATVASLIATGTNIQWYATAIGGTSLLGTTSLINGSIYYASQTVNACESPNRFPVTVTIITSLAPTGASTQTFCNSATIANLSVTGSNIQWYATATGGTSLSNTTPLVNGNTYYANQTVNGCLSPNRFPVLVIINIPSTPTGTSTQTFCNSGTISNLLVTGSNIRWYAIATGGTPLSNTTALVNGTTYYASQTISGCESLIRFPVNVIINTPASPTGNSNQLFCNSATVSNLTITGQNIQWYTTATGGTPLTNTTSLINGATYYASQTINGCESLIRTPVSVTITVVPTPTGISMQEFCKIDNPKVSNLIPNLPNIKWYTTLTGGSPLNTNTPLINNASYFAEAIDITTGCKSPARLEVVVKINDSNPPTGELEQIFCEVDNPLVSNLIMNANNSLVWYDSVTGNNLVADSTPLSNGDIFYASNFDSTTNCYSSERTKVDIILLPCELEINNLLTLNGNNLNDYIVIKNIETFPKNEFQIFNRYGKLVWRGYNYNNLQNTFTGKANVQGVYNSNDYLPTGTYFYVLTYFDMYRNENKEVKGFLQINNNQ